MLTRLGGDIETKNLIYRLMGVTMNNENGKIHNAIEHVFHTANNELFAVYKLEFESSRKITTGHETAIIGDSIMSILTASGEGVKILSSIKMSCATATAISPDSDLPHSTEALQDLCGELNNQLVGKVKNKMLGYDCKLMLGLPTCITGKNVSSHSPQHAVVVERLYRCNAETVAVCLHTVVHPAFEMLDEPNNELTGEVSEGELSFF